MLCRGASEGCSRYKSPYPFDTDQRDQAFSKSYWDPIHLSRTKACLIWLAQRVETGCCNRLPGLGQSVTFRGGLGSMIHSINKGVILHEDCTQVLRKTQVPKAQNLGTIFMGISKGAFVMPQYVGAFPSCPILEIMICSP